MVETHFSVNNPSVGYLPHSRCSISSDMNPLLPVLRAILTQYTLPLDGDHGVSHWARVLENGQRLAEATGANLEVVRLFAVLHDSRRINEITDPGHGARAATFAAELRGVSFDLLDDEFTLLHQACVGHTYERTHPDITVQTCWDADRLDLGRVGITPDPSRLCTAAAKTSEMVNWAHGRACSRIVPACVAQQSGVEVR
jgi:uncharacterized protein